MRAIAGTRSPPRDESVRPEPQWRWYRVASLLHRSFWILPRRRGHRGSRRAKSRFQIFRGAANVRTEVSRLAYLSRKLFVSVSRVLPTRIIIMSGVPSMLCAILILSVSTTTVRAGLKCDAVRPYFESQGFPASDIPKEAISCKHHTAS